MTLLDDDTTDGPHTHPFHEPDSRRLLVAGHAIRSRQGRRRSRNEDAALAQPPVFVVADGMGGLAHSHRIVALAAAEFASSWLDSGNPADALSRANLAVRSATPPSGRAGCTLSAVRLTRDQAIIVHVGDSRIYRVRNGAVGLLTRDHNLRTELLDAGIVPQRGTTTGPLGALTSFLGMADDVGHADIRSVGVRRGDRLVLCTDGVFGHLSHADLSHLMTGGDPDTCAERLTAGVATDDATCIVLDIERGGA